MRDKWWMINDDCKWWLVSNRDWWYSCCWWWHMVVHSSSWSSPQGSLSMWADESLREGSSWAWFPTARIQDSSIVNNANKGLHDKMDRRCERYSLRLLFFQSSVKMQWENLDFNTFFKLTKRGSFVIRDIYGEIWIALICTCLVRFWRTRPPTLGSQQKSEALRDLCIFFLNIVLSKKKLDNTMDDTLLSFFFQAFWSRGQERRANLGFLLPIKAAAMGSSFNAGVSSAGNVEDCSKVPKTKWPWCRCGGRKIRSVLKTTGHGNDPHTKFLFAENEEHQDDFCGYMHIYIYIQI